MSLETLDAARRQVYERRENTLVSAPWPVLSLRYGCPRQVFGHRAVRVNDPDRRTAERVTDGGWLCLDCTWDEQLPWLRLGEK